MALKTVQQQRDVIVELLKNDGVRIIVLTGEAGVGKTWLAREISDYTNHKGLSYLTLWVFLNQQDGSRFLHDSRSLHESIARQLSVLSTTEEWEDDVKNEEPEEESLENLEKKISDKLEKMRSAVAPGEEKYLLIILDGVPDKMKEGDIMPKLEGLLHLNQNQNQNQSQQHLSKVLITRRHEPVVEGSVTNEINGVTTNELEGMKKVVEIKPLSEEDQLILLQEKIKKVSVFRGFEARSKEISLKSKGLPAAIVIIAEALNHIGEHDSGVWTLEGAVEEVATCEEAPDDVNPLLRCGYDMLRSTDKALIKCCWHSLQFFLKHGGIHYNELIACWILEGYLGPVEHVEKAYDEGHRVLVELMDRGMLKMLENNVVMEGLALKVPDCRRDGYEKTSDLGLATAFEDGDWQGLGRITPTDGMIKTLCNREKLDKVSTLLIDGSRLCREVPETFFQPMQGLQVLAVLNSRFKLLPSSFPKMDKLHLLVLRGCDQLRNIEDIQQLKSLRVLEISGASSLEPIPDPLFEQMIHLRSLNFSAVPIESLPSTVSKLSELRWLILRECERLEKLPRLVAFKKLEVLDLCGAISLNRIDDKNLSSLQKLQMLDLSHTQIDRLPILGKLEKLTRLLLRGCKSLSRLPNLKLLSALQILDLSGTIKLKEIQEDSLDNKNYLKVLDLSETAISHLPFNVGNLRNLELLDLSDASKLVEIQDHAFEQMIYLLHLNLSNTKVKNIPSLSRLCNLRQLLLRCCPLEKLPKLEGLSRLEKLDLFKAPNLVEIEDKSFEHLSYLCHVDFSNTKIKSLPSLSNLRNLHKLLLQGCGQLAELPLLNSLEKLQVLDLSGCSALTVIGNQSFQPSEEPSASSLGEIAKFLKPMIHLQFLNFSGTRLEFPSMSLLTNLTNLNQLSLGGCSLSESDLNLEKYTKLKVLDLSDTKISSLLSLNNLSNLRKLKLRNCSSLKKLQHLKSLIHLEVLDLWGTGIKEFPYEISELTRLKHLDLPDLAGLQKLDWENIKHLPEELNWVQCGIFKHAENRPAISVCGTELFQNLKKTPELWETYFKEFHFSVCSLKEKGKDGDICWHRIDPNFRKLYFKTLSFDEGDGRYLDLYGFDSFPSGVEDALMHAEYISLVENKFIKCLSDLVSSNVNETNAGNVMAMKGCQLERCTEMETIFSGEETEIRIAENLQILWASNLPMLKSVYSGNMQHGSFKNLIKLCLDCCPMLEIVFPTSQLSENLKILQIKFCNKLKMLFMPDASAACTLQNLHILRLVELPELTSIGVPESKFPSLEAIQVRECPKLERLEEICKLPNSSVENSKLEEY